MMRLIIIIVSLVAVVCVVWGVVELVKTRRNNKSQRTIDEFAEMVRELAWQYRDVSPELSAVIIDEVNKRRRELSR